MRTTALCAVAALALAGAAPIAQPQHTALDSFAAQAALAEPPAASTGAAAGADDDAVLGLSPTPAGFKPGPGKGEGGESDAEHIEVRSAPRTARRGGARSPRRAARG